MTNSTAAAAQRSLSTSRDEATAKGVAKDRAQSVDHSAVASPRWEERDVLS